MNWLKKISQKAMPLPFSNRPKTTVQTTGLDEMDYRMKQETADQVRKDYSPEYYDAGTRGVAMSDPNNQNVILKITDSDGEMEVAKKQMSQSYPFLVKIFDVKRIQEWPRLYLITSEKVKILTEPEQKAIKDLIRSAYTAGANFQRIPEFIKLQTVKNQLLHYYPNEIDTILKYVHMLEQMNEHGFYTNDAGPKNVGINSIEDMVLLDLGSSKF